MSESDLYYSRDPIVESVLGIAVHPALVTFDDLEKLKLEFGDDYASQPSAAEFTGEIKFEKADVTGSRSQSGIRFTKMNGKEVVITRMGSFAYHRLMPYPGWVAFKQEAKRLWKIYHRGIGHQPILQGELRYINRLEIPARQEISLYLQTYPQIGKALPQTLGGYEMTATLPLDTMPGHLLVRQSMIASDLPDHTSIILDNTISFLTGDGEDALWHLFEQARAEKNRYFQGCITFEMESILK